MGCSVARPSRCATTAYSTTGKQSVRPASQRALAAGDRCADWRMGGVAHLKLMIGNKMATTTTTTTNHRQQKREPASAADDDTASSSVDNLLHCPVCNNEFNAPKLLPCLHSYCFECLESSLAQSHIGPGQAFLCPLCKTQCVVPPRGVRAMKSNVFLVTLQVNHVD